MNPNAVRKLHEKSIPAFLQKESSKTNRDGTKISLPTRKGDRLSTRGMGPGSYGGSKIGHKSYECWLSQLKLASDVAVSDSHYHDTSELLLTAYNAYKLSHDYENFEIGENPTYGKVLHSIHQKLIVLSENIGFDCMYIEHENQSQFFLIEELTGFSELITVELKYLERLEKENPQLFHAIASIIHLFLKKKNIPDWQEIAIQVSEWNFDREENELNADLKSTLEFYKAGSPALWLKRLKRYKPMKLHELRKFDAGDKEINVIIENGLKVIDHPLSFHDYCNGLQDDEGLWLWQYIFLSWDFNDPVQEEYSDLLNNSYDAVPPRRAIHVKEAKDWAQQLHKNSFFQPLSIFCDALQQYFNSL